MTAMREEAFELLEKMPEDKLVFIIQIMQGVNSLYNSGAVESKKDAFLRMEQIRKKGKFPLLFLTNSHSIGADTPTAGPLR